MKEQAQRFLRTWILACIVLAVMAAVFNALVDPYLLVGVSRIDGFNARKPAVDTQQRLMKAYDVLRVMPNTVVLGTSRVNIGLDANDPAWPSDARPVYNLGFPGGGPYVSLRYLQHVMSERHLSLVVLGLDFEYFLTPSLNLPLVPQGKEDFESHLRVTPDGDVSVGQNWQHIRDLVQATFSLDALTDSSATIAANVYGDSSNLVAGNWDRASVRRAIAEMGPYSVFAKENLAFFHIHALSSETLNPLPMSSLRDILDLCELHGTRVILLINPMHADLLEIMDKMGHWRSFENWKHKLVALVTKYPRKSGRNPIPLWDFSGYGVYSTETLPGERPVLRWFWDSSHYKKELGNLMLKRIFGEGNADFGVLLTPGNIDSHLAAIHNEQREYRQNHDADVRRVHQMYEAFTDSQPSRLANAR